MDMSGEYRIEATREKVYKALNDPDILKACITGCDELIQTGDDSFEAKVTAKVGPVKAKFGGAVTISDQNPPESYTISGEGKGGAAGFAKGGAKIHLAEADGGAATILTYTVSANVGGKLAQLGSRLIDSTAKKYADDFFSKFRTQVELPVPVEQAPAKTGEAPPDSGSASDSGSVPDTGSEAAVAQPTPAKGGTPPPADEPAHPAEPAKRHGDAATLPPGQTHGAPSRPGAESSTTTAPADADSDAGKGLNPAIWIGGAVVALLVLILLFT